MSWLSRRRSAVPDVPDAAAARRAAYAARVAAHDERHPGYAAAWDAFARTLLAHGGDDVVPPGEPDVLVDMLRVQGAVQRPPGVVARAGERGDCHANAVRLWRDGATAGIGTGYALSPDGLWREHSWGVAADGTIVETTAERVAYFGLPIDPEWFAGWVGPPEHGEHGEHEEQGQQRSN